MKNMTKRMTAVLMTLVLLLSLCFYVYGQVYNTSAYNDGERHVVCDALSSAAKSYYSGSYSYDTLSGQSSSQILQSLRTLMKSTHDKSSSYNECKTLADQTDSTSGDGRINLIYTSKYTTESKLGSSGAVWNREHVWPKSLGGFETSGAGSDLHHIRPSDATINSARSNNKYGNVSGGKAAYGSALVGGALGGWVGGGYFEPLDNAKGDVARICLYVYVRYGGEINKCSSITNVFQSVDVLLKWCELDPVDEWEMGRNDVVEKMQGNRNVFIDYPEYAWLIFNEDVPEEMSTPSGKAGQQGTTPTPPVSTTPGATTPPTTLPPVTTPPATIPPATLPPVTIPPVTTPPATLPPVTIPPVTTPSATLPPVIIPSVTTPPATTPPVSTPAATPTVTTPTPTTPPATPSATTPPVITPGTTAPVVVPGTSAPAVVPGTSAPDLTPPTEGECTHAFGEWEDIGNGMKTRTCSLCGASEVSTKGDTAQADTGCNSVIYGTSAVIAPVAILGIALVARKKKDSN